MVDWFKTGNVLDRVEATVKGFCGDLALHLPESDADDDPPPRSLVVAVDEEELPAAHTPQEMNLDTIPFLVQFELHRVVGRQKLLALGTKPEVKEICQEENQHILLHKLLEIADIPPTNLLRHS